MIKAIIFDIGGVLREKIDIKNFWKNKKESKKLRNDFGIGKLSTKKFIKKASKLLGIPQKDFIERYRKAYGKLKLKKDVFKILKKIKTNKYLLSDNNPINFKYEKKKYGKIFKEVDKVFLSQNIGVRKDKIQAFKFVLKKIKVKPQEALMIDDKPVNIKNAGKLGMKTILFKNNEQLKKDLKKLGINF